VTTSWLESSCIILPLRTPREFGSIGGTSGREPRGTQYYAFNPLTTWNSSTMMASWVVLVDLQHRNSSKAITFPSHNSVKSKNMVWTGSYSFGTTSCQKKHIWKSSSKFFLHQKTPTVERSFDTTQGLFCTVSIDEHFEWHSNDGRLSKNFDLLKSQESNSLVFTYVCILSSCSPNSGWASRSVRDWCRGHSNRWEWSIFSSVSYHKLAFI